MLRRYRLPRSLLAETLDTYELLFPQNGSDASWKLLKAEVNNPKNSLDSFLLKPNLRSERESRQKGTRHDTYRDALGPYNVESLYDKYLHWADRLYDLYCEADDPMPASWLERLAESKRNPRFISICAMITIVLALLFGISATGLAAVQLWVGWCTWMDSNAVPQCGYQPEKPTDVVSSSMPIVSESPGAWRSGC
jgi:hypothetical protein